MRLEAKPRIEPCYRCGHKIDVHNQTWRSLQFEKRPVPDLEDMDFEDHFVTNYIICPDCAAELEDWLHSEKTNTGEE